MSRERERRGVYEGVKARIVARDPAIGKHILVEPLADRLFVSATPVREALIRLGAERIIDETPKSGFFLKDISRQEVAGLYTLQSLLLWWSLAGAGTSPPFAIEDEAGVERGMGDPQSSVATSSFSESGAGASPGAKRAPGAELSGPEAQSGLETELAPPPERLAALIADAGAVISPDAGVRILNDMTVHMARQSGNREIVAIVRNINDRTSYIRRKDLEYFPGASETLRDLCDSCIARDGPGLRDGYARWSRTQTARLPEVLRRLLAGAQGAP